MTTRTRDAAGESFHVRDCYVWAEIFYLDSPTDYREYLPQARTRPPAGEGQLVMLDELRALPASRTSLAPLFMIVLLLLGIAGYFLYLILEAAF